MLLFWDVNDLNNLATALCADIKTREKKKAAHRAATLFSV
jgi:ABC-type uncharacterized transport system YnjBCD ATPase subunit